MVVTKKTTWLRLWALALLWGSEFAFVKVALRGLNSAELVAVRLFLAAIFLFTFAKTKREPIPRDRGLYPVAETGLE